MGRNKKVELDLSIYATITDLKNTSVVDTSKVVKKFDTTGTSNAF